MFPRILTEIKMSESYHEFQKLVEKKRFKIEMRYMWHELSVWVLPICGLCFLFEKLSWWSIPVIVLVSLRYCLWATQWSKQCHDEMQAEVKEMRENEYEAFEKR